MADYLESYATHFRLPVRTGTRVDRLSREGDRYFVEVGDRRLEARHVVVAMSSYQRGVTPAFANQLDPAITQLHSVDYRRPSQLPPGDVLLVGAGNSGAEIAIDLARDGRRVWISGRDVGEVPFSVQRPMIRRLLLPIVFRLVFHRILTLNTPQLADGTVRRVSGVVWCTGFDMGQSWIDLPVFDGDGEPIQERDVVPGELDAANRRLPEGRVRPFAKRRSAFRPSSFFLANLRLSTTSSIDRLGCPWLLKPGFGSWLGQF
jgi:putative flavoprotein involved in K+ transport